MRRIRTSESSSFPCAATNQLEWSRADLLAGGSDADDDGHAPAFVTGFQSCPLNDSKRNTWLKMQIAHTIVLPSYHCCYISDALECIIWSTIGHPKQHLLDTLLMIFRIDEFCAAEFLS